MIAATLFTINANAGYLVKMPLEVPQGGHLPYNTIILGSATVTEPVFDTPDPLPTDNDVVCDYNLATTTVYLDGQTRASTDNAPWTPYKDVYYNGLPVLNGFKGKEMQRQESDDINVGYYEVCIKGEPIYSNYATNPADEWDQDDCRFDNASGNEEYIWKSTQTSDGRLAFTSANLGNLGSINANTSGLIFPEGTITVPEGKILPENNQRIVRGNVAFNRGNMYGNRNLGNNVFQYEFAVCKKTAK